MAQHKQDEKNSSSSKTRSDGMDRLAHWGRVTLMLLSFGMLYPNALTENMDLTKIQGETEGDLYKKKK